jgi:DNA invertase Pin-like site-specific DNA recombinase
MIYGYARVSTKEQNLDRQLAALEPICDVVKLRRFPVKI